MSCKILGIIPARGGSKRIPGKNLKNIDGKPLIVHTVEQAALSRRLHRSIISTDDQEIKQTVIDYGGEVPFDRPAELATDTAKTREVITHALDRLQDQGEHFDIVCKIQPTNPLRLPQDIDGAIDRLVSTESESVISVNEYHFPPDWALKEDEEGHLTENFHKRHLWEGNTRSQNSSKLYCPNGAVMAATVPAWQKYGTFYTDHTVAHKMPLTRSFDIDEPSDFRLVKQLIEGGS